MEETMKFCQKCGAQIANEELKFCSQCGAPLQAGPGQPQPPVQAPGPAPKASTGGMEDNVAGLLCYLGSFITGIIFLVIEPYNQKPFVRFHAFQSIFYAASCVIVGILFGIISTILFFVSATLGSIFSLLHMLIWLLLFVLWIFLMYKAYSNDKFKLPVIGQMAENQATK
jgi:uncharacterized membrane protein